VIKLKKAISTLLIIICLSSISGLVRYRISVKASTGLIYTQTSVIYVPANYSTIQEAINHANPGDEIFVNKSISPYVENIVVNKSISLVGEDRDFTTIESSGVGNVINVTANNVKITGFTIMKSGTPSPFDTGIRIEYSSGNIISHNKIINNYIGISIDFFGSTVISDNIISFNTFHGVYLYSSNNNTISGNTISSNGYNGVYLYSSRNNTISGNTILNNFYGIFLTSSSSNSIYHNNFDNINQAWSDSTDVWFYGDEGNYWSDYSGQDLNGDGIGDTVYTKNGVFDIYPLMGMFSLFNVTLQTKAYDVVFISNSTISEPVLGIGAETGDRMIIFNATGEEGTTGFCRIAIPTELMTYPYIVLIGIEKIIPALIGLSNGEYARLYFTYSNENHTLRIISPEALHLYYDLLDNYTKFLLNNYTKLFDSYSKLNVTYYDLLDNYTRFLLDNYTKFLLDNYTKLLDSYSELNASYQEHLLQYSEQMQNIRSLMYIFAAATAIFLITTIYLSRRAHAGTRVKTKVLEDEE
jgi:parallel beta-helix repeat protein